MVVFAVAWLVLALAWAFPAAAELTATAVRVGDHGDHTRFVVDLSGKVSFSVFTLPDPDRVVVDLPEVAWAAPPPDVGGGAGLVRAYRYGSFTPGTSRIVLDLARPVTVRQAFVLAPENGAGWRLVIDLVETTRESFQSSRGVRQGSEQGGAPPPLPPRVVVPAQPEPQPVAAVLPPRSRPDETRAAKEKPRPVAMPVVMIDPGHGGLDPGTIGVSGIHEKVITLAMGLELRDRLEATGRYRPLLTREDDVFITLRDRVAAARAAKADLFISLHADAIANETIRGLSVYTLSANSSDKEAAALAEKENKADLIAGLDLSHESPEVTNILIDLAQRETLNLSARFAGDVLREFRRDTKLLPKSHRFAGFAVLKAPDVPSVLLEMGYLSNVEEEQLLRQPTYRAKLAVAMVRSVDDFFKQAKKLARP
ncbi:MAG: N-acetylmuramoyl-L-alanine amidase [Alphaproteobacteria bacterium]